MGGSDGNSMGVLDGPLLTIFEYEPPLLLLLVVCSDCKGLHAPSAVPADVVKETIDRFALADVRTRVRSRKEALSTTYGAMQLNLGRPDARMSLPIDGFEIRNAYI